MKQNILFTCAGRRNYLILYFKEALKGHGLIIAADQDPLSAALKDADVSLVVPNIYSNNYINSLKEIIKTHNITALISLNDLELPMLSEYKQDLEQTGVKMLVSSKEVIDIGGDKWKTYHFIKQIGLNTPKTYLAMEEVLKALHNKEITFPLVLKPRWGSSSIGLEFPESIEELKLAYDYLKIKIKRSVLSTLSLQDSEQAIIFQEKMEGIEYGLDIVNNFKGTYFNSFIREKLGMRAGETDKAKSVFNPNITQVASTIAQHLKHIGTMDADVFIAEDKVYVLELNPRFGGGYPFSHEAGANIAAVYIDWLNGCNDLEASKHIHYIPDIIHSKCDRLLKMDNP